MKWRKAAHAQRNITRITANLGSFLLFSCTAIAASPRSGFNRKVLFSVLKHKGPRPFQELRISRTFGHESNLCL